MYSNVLKLSAYLQEASEECIRVQKRNAFWELGKLSGQLCSGVSAGVRCQLSYTPKATFNLCSLPLT